MNEAPDNWKDYELAVARFIAAISPNARVIHDAHLPDRDTGFRRPRDVWVEWVHAGLLPITALISSKFWSEPLNQQDIDHFNGEYISSGSRLGVIFAKPGFNDAAVEKCRKLGYYCCKLYSNQPVELNSGDNHKPDCSSWPSDRPLERLRSMGSRYGMGVSDGLYEPSFR